MKGGLCFLESLGSEFLLLLNQLSLKIILPCPQILSLFHAMVHPVGTYRNGNGFNEGLGYGRGYAFHKHRYFEFDINMFSFLTVLLPS